MFAGRLMQYLSLLDDRQAVVAGGAQSRSHLCGNGLCDLKAYKAAHGVVPGIFGFAGGITNAAQVVGYYLRLNGDRERRLRRGPRSETRLREVYSVYL